MNHTKDTFIEVFPADVSSELELPFVENGIKAGFPSPAADFIDVCIDLNKHLIKNPASTFYGRIKGNSMRDAGLHDGDIVIIDKSLEPADGKIAVCFIDGDFTIKRIKKEKDGCWLMPANPEFSPIHVTEHNQFLIWGIVTYIIKKC
jgi:DNA polymerase V